MSFCSREALASGEGLAGTAPVGGAYVFLPVRKRLWRSTELNTAWARPGELAAIAQARGDGVVTRLYNPPRPPRPEGDRILVYAPHGRPAPRALSPLLALLAQRWPIDEAQRPRLAICIHGTRDRCCAKWGFAVYSEARRLFEQGAFPFEPLECSHLGGDRFAATGIFFPAGGMYAHLDGLDLAALAAVEAAGKIAPDRYRGRVYDPEVAQVVRAGLAGEGLYNDATAPLEITRQDPAAPEVLVTAGGNRFQVSLTTAAVRFYASCARLGEHRPSSGRRTVYVAGRRLA